MAPMKKLPKQIDLLPTEYTVDIANKKEPVFGDGWPALIGLLGPILIFLVLRYFGLR